MLKLLEALQSGKCFMRHNVVFQNRSDGRLYYWHAQLGQWKPASVLYEKNCDVEYVADPSMRPCTFLEAWEHMKKYPCQEVCVWKNQFRCHYANGDIFDHHDDDLFTNHCSRTIIDSDEWALIPQTEGE